MKGAGCSRLKIKLKRPLMGRRDRMIVAKWKKSGAGNTLKVTYGYYLFGMLPLFVRLVGVKGDPTFRIS